MRVGFLNNQIDNRGTGNALFDYAHYNEEILGNESLIFSLEHGLSNGEMLQKLTRRFGRVRFFNELIMGDHNLDVLYHIKSGFNDGFYDQIKNVTRIPKYVVHSVFDNQPHGSVYAFVSDWLARRNGGISVPHIVSVNGDEGSLREELGIREDCTVFGRHGGADSFDISFAWDAINEATLIDSNLFFIFLNTNKPNINLKMVGKQIFFLPDTADPVRKKRFINSCNAMIHARGRGETFGIAVGEFDIVGKPILTYANSPETAHIENAALTRVYDNRHELLIAFLDHSWLWSSLPLRSNYRIYTPQNVMKRFKEVFLD